MSEPVTLPPRTLAELCTELWRLRRKMLEADRPQPRTEMADAYRHVEAAWDLLADAGLTIDDPTGRPFDSGMPLKALAFQPTAGLTRETVVETIRPTIFLRDARLQMGEVIVGTP